MQQIKAGQIVRIRNRLWRIDSIYNNELTATSIDSLYNFQKRFYIPLEDIKPATIDVPPTDKIGELSKQQLLINAYRISLIHGTSLLMSLQLSRVIPANFQLVPVVMALNTPRVRLLIADDIGLGKTIEAGLILNELIARHMARKILVICPASLREQWQETLFNFFNVEFQIISSLHKRYLEKKLPIGLSPWDYFQKLITSVDYAKARANRNEILNYDWDLVIVDETHLCSRPHGEISSKTTTMQRWELLRDISRKTTHLLLLTATPHNGYTDSFASLVEVLDINATDARDTNFIDKEKAMQHVCQRRRKDVEQWLKVESGGFNPFPDRDQKEVRIETLTKAEVDVYRKLKDYSKELIKLTSGLAFQYAVQFTILHFMKRALSSPYALRMSLQNRIRKLRENLTSKTIIEGISKMDALSTITESDNLESITTEEAARRIEHTTFGDHINKYEMEILNGILEEARKIRLSGDSKYMKLIKETIPELLGYSKKIIIFTRYKDTLDYLQKNLEKDCEDMKLLTIYGNMRSEQRTEVFKNFEMAEQAILIATDCISEGLNLQYLCSQLIHYELPWNPNRLEQRNGRVDRFGQPDDIIHIRTMIVEGTLDDDILERIIERADRIRAEFGFSPPFFNDETAILKRLMRLGKTPRTRRGKRDDSSQLSLFDLFASTQHEEIADQMADKDLEEEAIRKQLEQIKNDSFYGQADIKLPDVEKKLRETTDTIGSREEIEKFIISSLKLFQCDIQHKDDNTYTLILNDRNLMLQGLGSRIENCTFDKNYAARHPGAELLDLSHPLVTRIVQILKRQMYLDDSQYGRTAYKISDVIHCPIAIIKVLTRYVVETKRPSVVEEILTFGFEIYNQQILLPEQVKRFELGIPLPGRRSPSEFRDDMREVYGNNRYWEGELRNIIEKKRQEIMEERKHLIETLRYEELPSWLEGVTNISYASHEIITVTLGYPA